MCSRLPVLLFINIIFILLSFLIPTQVEAKLIMEPMDGTTNIDLRGITGSSPTDVYAVGKRGTILHYDGTQCKQLPTSSKKDLNGIWGSFEKGIINVFAVGKKGTILHYDGTQCKQLPTHSGEDLNGAWGSFENGIINVFAVGDRGTILRYDGTQWFQMSNPEQSKLNGIWGNSSNSIFAVGDEGTILHYDGTRWLSLPKHTLENLNAVSGCNETSGIKVYAVGEKGTILHFDGTQWTKMNSSVYNNLNDIYGRQPNNIFAVGQKNTVIHFDGEKWSQISEPAHTNLYAVWVSENPHVFVVGQGGFIGGQPAGYWIKGHVFDACSNCAPSATNPNPIAGAQVAALNEVWTTIGTTGPTGGYGCPDGNPPNPIQLSLQQNTLRFSRIGYKTEYVSVTLMNQFIIETNTYMLHTTNSTYCISGVVSHIPPTYPNFYQSTSNIPIILYRVIDCDLMQAGTTVTNSEGHYCFSGLSAGLYKVVPQINYDPEYDNLHISIPQQTPQAFNFIVQ